MWRGSRGPRSVVCMLRAALCCVPAASQILRGLTAKYKDRPFSYLWAAGGAQPAVAANFGVGGAAGPPSGLLAAMPDTSHPCLPWPCPFGCLAWPRLPA